MNKRRKPAAQTGMSDHVSHELIQTPDSAISQLDTSRLMRLEDKVKTYTSLGIARWIYRLEDRINELEQQLHHAKNH